MKGLNKLIIIVFLLIPVLLFSNCRQQFDNPVMRSMVKRLVPQHAEQFVFEELNDTTDVFEVESSDEKIIIRGNNENSMAVGLNHYLKYYCLTSVSWHLHDSIQVPAKLPAVAEKIRINARTKNRFFLNYCTIGYTMPWWQWEQWERFIDWMALNGVNMPLATSGQESVWHKVWSKLGLTDEEIRNYFTGPAYLPWHRMANIDSWQGPLPKEWMDDQEELQKKIVAREREFKMKPVLPAFAGHVPPALKRIYPDLKMTQVKYWARFGDQYRCYFLDPLDPLFANIQKEYLEEQTKLFGTDHIYGVDPFNEIDPPSWATDSLASFSKNIYASIEAVDKDATWLQMTWLFYFARKKWTGERIESYITAPPSSKMLLLDYYCDNTEVWKQTDRYHGRPYLWCYLGNFGENTALMGNLKETGEKIETVFTEGGNNFSGLGCTLEGLDINPFMYEYVLEKAWDYKISDELWIQKHADSRAGVPSENVRKAWRDLYNKIYVQGVHTRNGTSTTRPTFAGEGYPNTHVKIGYDNKDLLLVWQNLLKERDCDRVSYLFDIVNVGRQVLDNYSVTLRKEFTEAYKKKDIATMKQKGDEIQTLLTEMNLLLSYHSTFSLSKWISDARAMGKDDESKRFYEENARSILTIWGDTDRLVDYARRSWSGLNSTYYAPRWKMFTDKAIRDVQNGRKFDEEAFKAELNTFERNWAKSTSPLPLINHSQTVMEVATELAAKYADRINESED